MATEQATTGEATTADPPPKCERAHCDDMDGDCPLNDVFGPATDRLDVGRIQGVFDRLGPERDRHTDWLRCTEEPWFSLAGLFRGAGG